jgi:hypothetical protein
LPTNSQIFKFFDTLFYTHKDRRQRDVSSSEYNALSPEAKAYLIRVWEYVKTFNPTYQRLNKVLNPETNQPISTERDKINNLVSGGYFGGFRGGMLGAPGREEATDLPNIPSQEVADNIKQAFI